MNLLSNSVAEGPVAERKSLKFNDAAGLKISSIGGGCLSNPGSATGCAHGLTLAFALKMAQVNKKQVIVDTLGQTTTNSLGYYVLVELVCILILLFGVIDVICN